MSQTTLNTNLNVCWKPFHKRIPFCITNIYSNIQHNDVQSIYGRKKTTYRYFNGVAMSELWNDISTVLSLLQLFFPKANITLIYLTNACIQIDLQMNRWQSGDVNLQLSCHNLRAMTHADGWQMNASFPALTFSVPSRTVALLLFLTYRFNSWAPHSFSAFLQPQFSPFLFTDVIQPQ